MSTLKERLKATKEAWENRSRREGNNAGERFATHFGDYSDLMALRAFVLADTSGEESQLAALVACYELETDLSRKEVLERLFDDATPHDNYVVAFAQAAYDTLNEADED